MTAVLITSIICATTVACVFIGICGNAIVNRNDYNFNRRWRKEIENLKTEIEELKREAK